MKNTLFYYGYPSSFNYGDNRWINSEVAQDMSQYDIVVLGGGLEKFNHEDHNNTKDIISQMSSGTQIFGYVTLNQPVYIIRNKIRAWNKMGVDGIFVDEAGYDFDGNRRKFNFIINIIHNQLSANIAFVNAWNPDHVMGIVEDPSYPNNKYNPMLMPSRLNSSDWYLLESCPINADVYEMDEYHINKCNKCQELHNLYSINMGTVSTISNDNPDGAYLYDGHIEIANYYGFDAQGSSDIGYGASSSTVKKWG